MTGPKPPKTDESENDDLDPIESAPGSKSITKIKAADPKLLESMKPPPPADEE
jgi:hypothetical protein